MKFYYENTNGDYGIFEADDIIKAIYSAWNIEADLYIVPNNTNLHNIQDGIVKLDLVFSSWASNDFNNDLLDRFGYYEDDGDDGYRHIYRLSDDVYAGISWDKTIRLV